MGLKHRERVWKIPPGYLSHTERLVLLALADKTHDDRQQWGHDRAEILRMVGVDPEVDEDEKARLRAEDKKIPNVSKKANEWLRRHLKSLEDQGFIFRRQQERDDETGDWKRIVIKLGHFGHEPWHLYEPTEAAAAATRRADQLREAAPDPKERQRGRGGRFSRGGPTGDAVHGDGGPLTHGDGGHPIHGDGGDPSTATVDLYRTDGHRTDIERTIAEPSLGASQHQSSIDDLTELLTARMDMDQNL